MQEDPWSWLWSTMIQVELFRLLPSLWDSIGKKEKKVLAELILAGPPQNRFRDDIEHDEWVELRDGEIWDRLIRLSQSSAPLVEEARARLDEISEEYPEWELTGSDKEDFPGWSEARYGYDTDISASELAGLPPIEQLEVLLSGRHYRDGRLSVWEGLVMDEPNCAFPLIDSMVDSGDIDQRVLAATFRGIASSESRTPELLGRVLAVAEAIPQDAWGSGIHPFARTVKSLFEQNYSEMLAEVLQLWDNAITPALRSTFDSDSRDLLTQGINHPAGVLTEALIELVRSETRDQGSEVPDSIKTRLESFLPSTGHRSGQVGSVAARVIIYFKLSLLHESSADWTAENIVPLFDWQNPEEAAVAWQGFLASPRIAPELWSNLRPHFLDAFDNYETIGHRRTKLPERLAAVYISGYPLTDAEAMQCLRKAGAAGETGLVSTANFLGELLTGAGDKASQFWTDKVGNFFRRVWPRDEDLQTPRLTLYIAVAAVRSGEAFPDAVDAVTPLLSKLQDPSYALRKIADSTHPDQYPSQTLTLIDTLIADQASLRQTQLPGILQRVQEAGVDPDDEGYNRLLEASRRG